MVNHKKSKFVTFTIHQLGAKILVRQYSLLFQKSDTVQRSTKQETVIWQHQKLLITIWSHIQNLKSIHLLEAEIIVMIFRWTDRMTDGWIDKMNQIHVYLLLLKGKNKQYLPLLKGGISNLKYRHHMKTQGNWKKLV